MQHILAHVESAPHVHPEEIVILIGVAILAWFIAPKLQAIINKRK